MFPHPLNPCKRILSLSKCTIGFTPKYCSMSVSSSLFQSSLNDIAGHRDLRFWSMLSNTDQKQLASTTLQLWDYLHLVNNLSSSRQITHCTSLRQYLYINFLFWWWLEAEAWFVPFDNPALENSSGRVW